MLSIISCDEAAGRGASSGSIRGQQQQRVGAGRSQCFHTAHGECCCTRKPYPATQPTVGPPTATEPHLWRHPARVRDALDLEAGPVGQALGEAEVANLDLEAGRQAALMSPQATAQATHRERAKGTKQHSARHTHTQATHLAVCAHKQVG